jgi:arylsulfatase A-like enzyme
MLKYLSLIASTLYTSSFALPNSNSPNILVVTLDDVGYSDIGALGAEWSTTNLDRFLSNSVEFTHHYSGYTDSASRSQLLTGVHSYHTGYGELGSSFGTSTIGAIPIGTPTLAEYIKEFSTNKYNTYYIGTWDLGHSLDAHTPNSRGFDYFYGMLTNENDVITKKSSVNINEIDPSYITKHHKSFIDFWENTNIIDENIASLTDSIHNFQKRQLKLLKIVKIHLIFMYTYHFKVQNHIQDLVHMIKVLIQNVIIY